MLLNWSFTRAAATEQSVRPISPGTDPVGPAGSAVSTAWIPASFKQRRSSRSGAALDRLAHRTAVRISARSDSWSVAERTSRGLARHTIALQIFPAWKQQRARSSTLRPSGARRSENALAAPPAPWVGGGPRRIGPFWPVAGSPAPLAAPLPLDYGLWILWKSCWL